MRPPFLFNSNIQKNVLQIEVLSGLPHKLSSYSPTVYDGFKIVIVISLPNLIDIVQIDR